MHDKAVLPHLCDLWSMHHLDLHLQAEQSTGMEIQWRARKWEKYARARLLEEKYPVQFLLRVWNGRKS